MQGLIVRAQSGFYQVQTDDDLLVCQLRGLLKRGRRRGDVVAVGDRVEITRLPDGSGTIHTVLPRLRTLSRTAPDPQGLYHQILVANLDQAVFIFSCSQPAPRFGMLDRFLVIAEKQAIPAVIVANKVDLVGQEVAEELYGHYRRLGYLLFYTSVISGQGLPELRSELSGKLSVFAGPSGVGKSSLLNVLLPGLKLEARDVSRATQKGRHTTVVRELYPLQEGGYVADTPGLKALALWDIEPEELDGYFPEMRGRVAECQFSDCTHVHEPGCSIRHAVEQGQIHPARYNSYLRMRLGDEE